jgi:phosphatidylglycerophosphate synthase
MDVFGDRYLTVISCIYVGFRGVSLVPLAVMLMRELFSVAMRMVQIDGRGIMVQNRMVGGFIHAVIAVGTLGFIVSPLKSPNEWFYLPFYAIAIAYALYFPVTIYLSRKNIVASIRADLSKPL